MKKSIEIIVFTAVIAAAVIIPLSCSKESENIDVEPLTKEEISDSSLWERISNEADYTAYEFWPGHEGLSPGQAPHGPFHKVYINHTIASELPIDDRIVPVGGIVVKENYSNGEELSAITVMAKVEGYDPEHNDWFWAKYSPDGSTDAAGKLEGCISCHAGMEQNDYIIIHPLDEN